MAKNRYRQKARLRRQYTLTGTKACAAFFLSIFFSLILDSYFDRYGPRVLAQIKDLMIGAAAAHSGSEASANATNQAPPQPAPTRSAFDPSFRERLNQLDKNTAVGEPNVPLLGHGR